eukprot:m.31287 g.31287  ORF g.31287 m.31287 type:complete len:90 (+) comp9710_c0_seq1:1326-1595(+)
MGGLNLEMLRMGLYVFLPIGAFWYFNLPDFYNKSVRPELEAVFPPIETTNRNLPFTQEETDALLAKLKAQQLGKAREQAAKSAEKQSPA